MNNRSVPFSHYKNRTHLMNARCCNAFLNLLIVSISVPDEYLLSCINYIFFLTIDQVDNVAKASRYCFLLYTIDAMLRHTGVRPDRSRASSSGSSRADDKTTDRRTHTHTLARSRVPILIVPRTFYIQWLNGSAINIFSRLIAECHRNK